MPDRPLHRALLVGLLCAGGVASLAAAEVPSGAGRAQSYRVRRWTTDQGLPQNRISCLKQTRDGYLWIGTWFGLARFDGVHFTVFDKSNTPELVNDAINALAEDTDGTLWMGTADGLLSYRDRHFHRLTVADGLPDAKVWRLAARRSGGIWLQSGSSVARLEDGKLSCIWHLKETSQPDRIHSLREGAEGWLRIVMDRAWLALSPQGDELRTNAVVKVWESYLLAGLAASSTDDLWFGTRQGLLRLKPGASKAVGTDGFGERWVNFIHEDRAGNLWVNTQPGGLYRRNEGQWEAIELEDHHSLPVTCMEEDREGSVWVGTDGGLVQLQKRTVRTYGTRDGLVDDHVWSVCEGTDGTIWVGTRRGLGHIQNGKVVPLGTQEILPSEADRSVWPLRDGGVLIAKPRAGLYEFRSNFRYLVPPDILPNLNISALYEDRSARLWIGTGNGVATIKDNQVVASYTNWAGHSGYDVRCILQDREGAFWFGTQGQGLTRLRDGKFDVFTERDGLSNNRVWSIHEDAEGGLWLGTENGLTRYREGRFFSFGPSQGLLENAVNWILEDDLGFLWLSGLRGIYRVKRELLNGVAEGRARAVECAVLGTADGMESSETNGEGQPAGWKARDGRLWFPTTRGVVVIDPKNIELSEIPPPVVIEQVRADEDDLEIRNPKNRNLKLAAGRARVLEIQYTANTFAAPERAQFKYKLEPSDRDWVSAGTRRLAIYTNLRPGDYKFRVKASNPHGVWNETGASFQFSLAPRFYETWLFYGGCGLAGLGLAAGVPAFRLRVQRRILKLEQAQAVHEERARIARDLHDELGSRLTALAVRTELAGANRNGSPDEKLRALADESRALAERMRDVIWTADPECDSFEALAARLSEHGEAFLGPAGIRLRLELPEVLPALSLPADARHQLMMVAKEALNNVLKHARASEVRLGLELREKELCLRVSDNGAGFEESYRPGRGLANMRTRLETLGGVVKVDSKPGAGTMIEASVPLKNLTASKT